MKRQFLDRGKIFASHISDEGRVYRIGKELLKFNRKKMNSPIKKMGKRSEQTLHQKNESCTDGKYT